MMPALATARPLPLDAGLLLGWPAQRAVHRYDVRDCILYALGVGVGVRPLDADELRFVYEKRIRVLPTMAVTLGVGHSDFLSDPRTGIDLARVLHGEIALDVHRPLPAAGTIVGMTRITGLIDKGPRIGAVLHYERRLAEQGSAALLCVERGTYLLQGNGGFSGQVSAGVPPVPPASRTVPTTAPDWQFVTHVSPRAALIYRLSGDLNPLHADPEAAAQIGFDRPILHGACAFGAIGRDLLRHVCGDVPERMQHLGVRFSAPVRPGDALETRVWLAAAGSASFETRIAGSSTVVLSRGTLRFGQDTGIDTPFTPSKGATHA